MTCAKQRVIALVVTPTGEVFIGENACANPQKECPRRGMKTGEGYELCKNICHQGAHAEVNACNNAGDKAQGATLYLIGHTYTCEACKAHAKAAGIKEIIIV